MQLETFTTNTKEDGYALQLLLWTASQLGGWARLKAIENKRSWHTMLHVLSAHDETYFLDLHSVSNK